jgi:DNA-directed RNA polymerase subunit RPC12/RpoP
MKSIDSDAAIRGKLKPGRQQAFGSLDRGSLPAPARYLSERGLLPGKRNREWVLIRCPSHKGGDERKPSLGVSLVDGHFRCHACGAKGGDVVGLHRLITRGRKVRCRNCRRKT